jgi:hypothetical protein
VNDLHDRLAELAEAAARDSHTEGAAAAIRRGRRRRRHRTGGSAAVALLVVVAAVGAARLTGWGAVDARPAGPPASTLPPTVSIDMSTGPILDGTPERQALDDLTHELRRCRTGDAGIDVIGKGRAHGRFWIVAARAPVPGDKGLCWVNGLWARDGSGNFSGIGMTGGLPPEIKPLTYTGGTVTDTFVEVTGTMPRQAARVRVVLAGGTSVDVAPLDPGDGYPVKFFIAFVPRRDGSDAEVTGLRALDASGRTIAECDTAADPYQDPSSCTPKSPVKYPGEGWRYED